MISIEEIYNKFKVNPVVSTDSRNIISGSIFFALKGPAFNGNQFAESALAKGALFAVIDDPSFCKNDNYLLVDDVLVALQSLANFHRRRLKIPFLAITGSNGKTTTKELISNVLSKKLKTTATKGNLNNHIGVPLTILSIPADAEFAVIEMGANHQGEISSYCKIAEPDYGLITNIGKAHLEGFGGVEGIKKGKGELYESIAQNGKGVFINSNNSVLKEMSMKQKMPALISYGSGTDVYCSGIVTNEQPFISVEWQCGTNFGTARSQLTGVYNSENILSAICIGNYFGIAAADIDDAIAGYVPDNSRSQVVRRGSNTIILDAYNANPTSMEAALNNFEKISSDKKIVLIGDMAELGEYSQSEHQRIADLLEGKNYNTVVFVGKNFGRISSKVNAIRFDDSALATQWLRQNPVENAYILIKGSRSSKMEKLLEAL